MIRIVAALVVSIAMMIGLRAWLLDRWEKLPPGTEVVRITATAVADQEAEVGPTVVGSGAEMSVDLVELNPRLSADLAGLQSSDPAERAAAAVGLATGSAVPAVREALTTALVADPDPVVRTKVAYAMGRLGEPHFSDPLRVALVRDRDARVRGKAAWALGQIQDPAARIDLRDAARREREVDAVRHQALVALAKVGDEESARALIDIARTPGVSEYLVDQAIQQLASMGTVAVEPMIDAMRDLGQPLGEFTDNFIARHGNAAANVAAQQLRKRLQHHDDV